MKKTVLVLCILCIYTYQLIANPRNIHEIDYSLSKKKVFPKKISTYNTPLELINAHNFWIGCACIDAIQGNFTQEDVSTQVKKLFIVHDTDQTSIASIPDGLDFVLFTTESNISEQILQMWYKKIRPGGMLIGIRNDTVLRDIINKIYINENVRIDYVNPNLWYLQKKHFLSCIIPTYNRAHTLSEAIDSLYKQYLTVPFEVIVTDDASTDETQKLLHYYKQKYSNFHFYVHENNGGASKARTTCIEHACGDLIFNLDSDNYLESKSLQPLIDLLDTSGCDIATFGTIKYFRQMPSGRKLVSHAWNFKFPNNVGGFFDIFGNAHIPIGSGNYLFTKKSFERAKGYKGRVMETWRFGYKQLATGSKIVVLPNSYYWHRLSRDGKWNSNQLLNKNNPAAFKTCMEYPELISLNKDIYTDDIMNFLTNIESGAIKSIPADALEHLFIAYKYEEFKLFYDAVKEYDCAIAKGAQHKNIYTKRAIADQNHLFSSHYFFS